MSKHLILNWKKITGPEIVLQFGAVIVEVKNNKPLEIANYHVFIKLPNFVKANDNILLDILDEQAYLHWKNSPKVSLEEAVSNFAKFIQEFDTHNATIWGNIPMNDKLINDKFVVAAGLCIPATNTHPLRIKNIPNQSKLYDCLIDARQHAEYAIQRP